MKRFILYADLKPDKVEEYKEIHQNAWPEILELITKAHMHNYSISVRGTSVYTIYEYTGDDYEKDMAEMEKSPIMQKWWSHTKPCFLHHEEGWYYEDLEEVFYLK
ncbi:MAG: L-rhamnose mutarotase [Clostridia bacterium]|nr:L-rhamnose mutarotase [Clostridia bacterium]